MEKLVVQILLTLVLSVVLHFCVPLLFGIAAAYWVWLLISAVIVFGGFLFLDGDSFHSV